MGEVLGKLYIRMINPAAQDGEDTCHGHSCKSHSQSKKRAARDADSARHWVPLVYGETFGTARAF